jgi:hypothetical protein
MSITSTQHFGNISVIVRGYRNRPARLRANRLADGIEVFRDDPGKSIGWPSRDAYQDDPEVFSRLESAWKSGDTNALAKAWELARPLPLA